MPSISAALIEAVRTKDPSDESNVHPTSRSRLMSCNCSWRKFLSLFSQNFYPHHLKMMVLFVIAALHLAYSSQFLSTFQSYELLASQVEFHSPSNTGKVTSDDINIVRLLMIELIDYKKNLWMAVGAMCASLSMSAIIVFFYNAYWPHMNRFTKTAVCVVDMVSFISLPFLLGARMMIVRNLTTYIEPSLRAASHLVSVDKFMDELKCSITSRDPLPLCSVIIERSIFPVVILEYLIVLCLLTAAYILLAYLIEYCIRHWFPPSDQDEVGSGVLVKAV